MKLRRILLLLCAAAVCVTCEQQPPSDEDWLELDTPQGPVRGRRDPDADHLFVFYNIPYATTPTGENKFKAPLPARNWTNTFDASDDKRIVCPQGTVPEIGLMEGLTQAEDCLIANIYVPDTQEKNLSVVVHVHGGAFLLGFGRSFTANNLLKKKDVILVTFNYRLGIHGFLCLGTEDIPGNAGMKDQVELLRWVQRNIESYGGNPNDVTLIGSSAGSASVDLLMLSKSAEGLFHRASAESGGNLATFSIQRDPLLVAKYQALRFRFFNINDINALEKFYKTAPMALLISDVRFDRTDGIFLFSPCVEREKENEAFLTESPLSILQKGDFKKLPVLYGFADMEGLFRMNFFEIWKDKMNKKYSDFLPADLTFKSAAEKETVAERVKKFYFEDEPVSKDNVIGYVNFFTDALFAFSKLWAVKLYAEAGHDQIYLYEYSFVDENTPTVLDTDIRGADHGAQTAALADGPNENSETQESQNMRRIIRDSWHNFIKTGKPRPEWTVTGANSSPYMSLGRTVELKNEPLLPERMALWQGIYNKHYLNPISPPPTSHGFIVKISQFLMPLIIVVHVVLKSLV
ncbi:unnamed protein product [Chrysodeixis includens]|uniref:Carboxylesterase type B domain-containing protein n=1 Tax=Chrysodeixis includens TaxID=689277 RepID=A0A9P0BZ44_CHRIL|nr:unnamed protein product [Chrysodeixis includens]